MARILITSGPTRQYLDPVRYITNASSGKMGSALAAAALDAGHEVTIVSGPVHVQYPGEAEVVSILTTLELLQASHEVFRSCDGAIGAAAPCDYRPERVSQQKLKKTGGPMILELFETEDVMASLGDIKTSDQWLVGFALETDDARFRAITKMQKKSCDLMVLNDPTAINSDTNRIELLQKSGDTYGKFEGSKSLIAQHIIRAINETLIANIQSK